MAQLWRRAKVARSSSRWQQGVRGSLRGATAPSPSPSPSPSRAPASVALTFTFVLAVCRCPYSRRWPCLALTIALVPAFPLLPTHPRPAPSPSTSPPQDGLGSSITAASSTFDGTRSVSGGGGSHAGRAVPFIPTLTLPRRAQPAGLWAVASPASSPPPPPSSPHPHSQPHLHQVAASSQREATHRRAVISHRHCSRVAMRRRAPTVPAATVPLVHAQGKLMT